MLLCKEIKGTIQNPNIDKEINDFFESCNENINILDMMYSTTAIPYKTQNGAVNYQPVSSCLIFLEDTTGEDEE